MTTSRPAFLPPAPVRAPAPAHPRRNRSTTTCVAVASETAVARPPSRAEFARSPAVVDGLNADHVRELAALAVEYGTVTNDLSELQSVRATCFTRAGIALEAVMCDETGCCVCALETLSWPTGAVATADEALAALRAMVDGAGLDGNVLHSL